MINSDTTQRSILYVEDDEILARLFQKHLKRAGYDVDIAMDGASGLAVYHDKDYDIVVLDQNLPALSGLEVLQKLMAENANAPIIMLSALGNEDLVVQALNYGASDFIVKDVDGGYLRLMPIIIEKVIRQKQLEIEKRVAEEIAQKASQRFQHLVENVSDIIGIIDVAGTVRYASPSIKTMLGYSNLSDSFNIVHPDDLERFQNLLIHMSKQPLYTRMPIAMRLKHDNGSWRWMEGTITNLLTEATIRGFLVNLHDMTKVKEAQQELERERNILRTLIDAIPDFVYIKDREGRIMTCNKALATDHGVENPQDMVGKTIVDIGGESFRSYHEMDLQVMSKNEPIINTEDSFADEWYIINKIPLQDKNGAVTGMVGVRSDITERKQHEQKTITHNHRLLNLQVAGGAITSSLKVHDVMQNLASEIVQITGFQICTISNWNREEDSIQGVVFYDSLQKTYKNWDIIHDLRDYPVTKQVLTDWGIVQQTISQADLDEAEKDYMQSEQLKSMVMLPIVVQGQTVALVELEDQQVDRILDAEQVVIVELLLHQAGIAIQNARLFEQAQTEIKERQRAENALKESEEKLRSTLTSLDDLVFTFDDEGYFLDYYQPLNSQSKLLTSPESFIGKHYRDVLPAHIAQELDGIIIAVKASGHVQQMDYPLTIMDRELWFSAKVSMRYDVKSQYAGITVVSRNVTEQKRQRDEIQRRAIELEAVAKVSVATTTILNMEELLQSVVDLTKQSFNLYHAHIYLLDVMNRQLNLAAGTGEVGLQMVRDKHQISLDTVSSLVAQAARTWQSVAINDIRKNGRFLPNAALPDTKSELAVPLILGDELIGILDVQSDKVSSFDAATIQVMGILASQLVVAVKNARLFEDIQQQAQEIQRASSQYRALFEQSHDAVFLTDIDGIYIAANQRACDMLGYTLSEMLGSSYRDRDTLSGQHQNAKRLQQLNSGEKLAPYERVMKRKDNTEFPAEILTELVQDDAGNPLHIQSIVRDITERKRTEQALLEHQERLHALHDMASQSGADMNMMLQTALENACQLLQMELGIISKIEDTAYTIQYLVAPSESDWGHGHTLDLADTFCELAYTNDTAIGISHASASEYEQHPCYQKMNIESFLGAPLVVNGKRFGTLNFSSQIPRFGSFTEADKDFARLMAQWVSSVLEREAVQETLRESEERFRIMFEMAPIGIYLMTMDGELRRVNQTFCNLLGYEIEELQGIPLETIIYPDDRDIGKPMTGGAGQLQYHIEQRYLHKEGHTVYILLRATWISTSLQEPFYLMGQVVDITERKLAEDELSKHLRRLELLHQIEGEVTQTIEIQPVLQLALDTTIRFSRAKIGYIALYEGENLVIAHCIGKIERNIIGVKLSSKSISARVARQQEAELVDDTTIDPDYEILSPETKTQISIPLLSSGRIIGVLGLEADDTDYFIQEDFEFIKLIASRVSSALDNAQLFDKTQEQLETLTSLHDQMTYQAHHDPLTGLPNRALFHKQLDKALQDAATGEKQVGLLYIDLDGFKRVNDTLGHPVGDLLLQEVAKRLLLCVRENDMVARMGGDEFTVILSALPDSEPAQEVAQRILMTVREPYLIQGQKLFVSASIGLSFYPSDGRTTDELLRKADNALYSSKDSGKNTFQIYDSMANRRVIEQVAIGNLLHGVIERGELAVHYQPQISLHNNEVMGVEALLRWESPALGTVPPDKFLPIATELGLIVSISNWVWSEVCRQQSEWRQQGIDWILSANIAIPQFQQAEFVNILIDKLKQYNVPPNSIEIEVTEQLMIDNIEDAAEKVEQLRAVGVKVALDDFGTGYSSLSYLQKLHFDTIKIDRSLVMDIEADSSTRAKSEAIIKAIISLASSLDVIVIAEGVETEVQNNFMRQAGVSIVQGHLFSKALAPDKLQQWLTEYVPSK